MRGQRGQILVQGVRELVGLFVGEPGDQRRFLDDPAPVLVLPGEPGQRSVTRAVPGVSGGDSVEYALDAGSWDSVLRIMPSVAISEALIDDAATVLEEALARLS
jgi:hypothetical protein